MFDRIVKTVPVSVVLSMLLPFSTLSAEELTSSYGGSGGGQFVDFSDRQIAAIVIRSGKYVDAVQLGYRNGNSISWGPRHGGDGGTAYRINLDRNERIIEIGGRSGRFVDALYVRTNKRTYPTRGGNGGAPFRIRGDIKGLWGRSGAYIDAIGAVTRSRGSGGQSVGDVTKYQPGAGGGDEKDDSAPSLRFPARNTNSGGLGDWLRGHNRRLEDTVRMLAGSDSAFARYESGERAHCGNNVYCQIAYREDAIAFAVGNR